jgi:hypothetical protein
LDASKSEFGDHPLEIALEAGIAEDVLLGILQVFPGVEALAGMGHQHLRLLLEGGGDDLDRDVLFDGREGFKHVAAHVEVDLAGQQQCAIVHLRAALGDGHIEAAGGVGAVGWASQFVPN